MSAEIFLVIDPTRPAEEVLKALSAFADLTAISAALLLRGDLPENGYKSRAKQIVPAIQKLGAAALVEGDPGLVRLVGADGLHVQGGVKAVKEAVDALKPDFIVGAGDVRGRHDAMQKGELEVDYIQFGPLSGATSTEARELARWWAETMEIPSVLCDPQATVAAFEAEGSEFIGLMLFGTEAP